MTIQNALTVVAPVNPVKLEELRTLLNLIYAADVESNPVVPFSKIKTIHFARFVIIETQTELYPVQLSFSTNYDGEEQAHFDDMITNAGNGLKQIYNCCLNFNGDIKTYFNQYKIAYQAFYIGHRGRSVEQIRNEEKLQNTISNFIDNQNKSDGFKELDASVIKNKIEDYIKQQESFKWAVEDKGQSKLQRFLYYRGELIRITAILIVSLFIAIYASIFFAGGLNTAISIGVISTLVLIYILLLKYKLNKLENSDKSIISMAAVQHVSGLMDRENFVVQNQLTHLVEMKEGNFRLKTARFVFGAINLLARIFWNQGNLGGIPTIHFARWVIIDNNKRLLFFSNFDGSWENYLGDFIDKAFIGLTGVWSNTKNFPKTKNLINEGARDEQHFKEWTRQHQIPTQVWYSAYKDLSVENINNNTMIRSGLFRAMNEPEAQRWLERI